MADENAQEAAPKKSKTMLIVILVVVVNVVIIGAVAAVFLLGGKEEPKAEAEAAAAAAAAATPAAPGGGPGLLMPMDNFVVNIQSEEGGRYLKASLIVELKAENMGEAFAKWEKLLRNEVLVYLSGVDVEDTRSAKQKRKIEGKLKKILNDRIGTEMITGVYFTEFVTQ
jgi:flagellar protein FliL